ncbi:protein FAR-RED IMPAIRED RESPONSE 1-like [Bidens hawaiensis]|uniref:protein FAR-RED IMPAIRED RESPONSE 1-like n=1 Tax=Bidens hawaiensis TaxID=980011 RepID=UPI00404970CE
MDARRRLNEIKGMSRNEKLALYQSEKEKDDQEKVQSSKASIVPIVVHVKPEPIEHLEPWDDENKIKTLKGLMMSKGMAENHSSNVVISQVNASCKPVQGMVFEYVDHAYDFYCEYAKKVGFGVRKGGSYMNDGLLKSKYFTCSKGHKPPNSYDSMAEKDGSNRPYYKRRKRPTIRCGFRAQKSCCDDYSFENTVNNNGELDRLFWADEILKKNYLAFGDITSFVATFKTNKYKMVFVPFTAIDNHYRNVTVGSGLLSSESIESYSWLLKVFLDSFGIAPKVVVTDQDPAMKQAIFPVFPNSRHQLCMWHIMKKLADKVGVALCNNEDFKRKICDIVWTNAISQSEFEMQWELIMKECDLETNKWLSGMFEMRYDWIPAYYRDESLSGLMRTTSISESENHFLSSF